LNISVLKLYFLPLTIVIYLIDILGTTIGKTLITLYVLYKTIGVTTIAFTLFRIVAGLTVYALLKMFAAYLLNNVVIANMIRQSAILYEVMMPLMITVTDFLAASWWNVATAIMAAGAGFYAFYKLGEWVTGHIEGIAGAMLILALMVGLVTVAYYGVLGALAAKSIVSGWTLLAAAAGAGAIGLGIGAAKGYLFKESGEDMLGGDTMQAYMSQLEERVSTNSALGGGATDLYVDNLITANDDLGERAYASSYTTTKNRAGLGSGTF